ncbi:MAG: flagellar filament capping protein FliD [Acidimicrobiales bacterium]
MSTFSVDGLASGLDTTSIIEQLMVVESQPVVRLEQRRDDLEARSTAWSDLDARLERLGSAIDTIVDSDGVSVLVGESSNPDVTVTSTGPGSIGVFEVQVDQIATSHQLMSDRFATAADLVGAGQFTVSTGLAGIGVATVAPGAGGLTDGHYAIEITNVEGGTATIVFDGESHDVSSTGSVTLTNGDGNSITLTADGEFEEGVGRVSSIVADGTTTVGGLVTQLSSGSGSATIQIIDTGDESATPLTMVITAREPGEDNGITLDQSSGLLGAFTEIREATNSLVSMGEGALVIERSEVIVDGLVPGMAIDLTGAEVGESLRVNVTRDTEAIVANVSEVIDAANSLFSGISAYGRSDPENESIGLLAGDFSLRRLERQLRDAFSAVGTGTLVIGSQVGIETSQDGSVALNEATLTELITSDFAALETFFVGDGSDSGYLGRIADAANNASGVDGVVENAQENLEANVLTIEESIGRYERRLEGVEAALRRRFASMETLLSQLNAQSAFLAGQLGQSNGG